MLRWAIMFLVVAIIAGVLGFGGLAGAAGRDAALRVLGDQGQAFQLIFSIEAAAFVLAAILAVRATGGTAMKAGAAYETREIYA